MASAELGKSGHANRSKSISVTDAEVGADDTLATCGWDVMTSVLRLGCSQGLYPTL